MSGDEDSSVNPPLHERSWHDDSVHAFHLSDVNAEEGTATLTLDIDHIVEWIPKPDAYAFRIRPALLRFYGVFRLKVAVDYSVGPIAVTPFQIDGIRRTPVNGGSSGLMRYEIRVNSPSGELSFEAHDWSLTFTGPAVQSESQTLLRPTSPLDAGSMQSK